MSESTGTFNTNSLWLEMLQYLKTHHAEVCRHWFQQLDVVGMSGGVIRIRAENVVQRDYLDKRCKDQFIDTAQVVTGSLIAVQFVTTNDPAPVAGAVKLLPTREPAAAQPQMNAVSNITSQQPAMNDAEMSGASHMGASLDPHADTMIRPQQPHSHQPDRAPVMPGAASNAMPNEMPNTMQDDSVGNGQPYPAMRGMGDYIEAIPDQILLNPDYTFPNFVTGPCNRLAHAASLAVAQRPGDAYNPLFIHGGSGLGKTHLLQGVCQSMLDRNPRANICYLSCDSFKNQFMDSVQKGQMDQFRHRYRHVDILVIDDIHDIQQAERSQEEFFHTFNSLYQSKKQIVLSSDSAPDEIPSLEDRLVSRFHWGLVARVDKPCYETRVAIVKKKAEIRGIVIPDQVVTYLASKIETNTRELEGALTGIQARAMLSGGIITLEMAQETLQDVPSTQAAAPTSIQSVIDVITSYYDVKLTDLQSKRRHRSITAPRQVCMYLARSHTNLSLEEIGGYFGGRDHTTVMHAVEKVTANIKTDKQFASQIETLENRLNDNTI